MTTSDMVETAAQIREALVAGFAQRLARVPDERLGGFLFSDPSRVLEVGERAASMVLAPSAWDDAVDFAVSTASLARGLGISRQAIAKRVAAGTLLGVPGRGTTLFPYWQFEEAPGPMRVHPAVAGALAAWREELGSLDPYAFIAWAGTPQTELHDATPMDYLDKGDVDAGLLAWVARIAAARLAQ